MRAPVQWTIAFRLFRQPTARVHALAFVLALALLAIPAQGASPKIPARLSDAEFWSLSTQLSEPAGTFRSENYLSNERGFQQVIPRLIERVAPGEVYVGVGPEQNFSYIVAVKPRVAFILDIRRGNLLEHLLYKALFEMSQDRGDFLSRLFSRERPTSLSRQSTVTDLFAAYQRAEPRLDLYESNAREVVGRLTNEHHFPLDDEDVVAIRNIYLRAFFTGGPNLNYAFGGGNGGAVAPSYQDLMLSEDASGINWSYLASEENFGAVRTLEMKNLIVPVVGDFAGPTALRGIGEYVRQRGATVSVFYLSNVEDYLVDDNRWDEFCGNAATLPIGRWSTFVFSGGGPTPVNHPRIAAGLASRLRPMLPDIQRCIIASQHRN